MTALSLSGFLDFVRGLLDDPLLILLALALLALLAVVLVVWFVRRVKSEEVWSHHAFGSTFRPKWRR